MGRLIEEYIAILGGYDTNPSERFWHLAELIEEDKKDVGVQLRMSRSYLVFNLMSLLKEGAIFREDLDEFSDTLKETVSRFLRDKEVILNMDIIQAIEERHSVRAYTTQKIEEEKRQRLQTVVDECNAEGGLDIFIRYDDPEGFDSRMAHYGSFRNVNNYIVLAGPADRDIEEACGYYGERIVLEAQMLGLNTCWAALTFNKKMVQKLIPEGRKLCMVIALGYGESQGAAHKGKSLEQLVVSKGAMPDWFRKGAEAAMLAPTAVNQQKFEMGVKDGEPVIRVSGRGFYTKTDLGIVKYHFEAASGRKVRLQGAQEA